MCCLFGMIDYGHGFTGKQRARIIHALAAAAEARGTDASGIAYNSGGKLHICKRPLPGHLLPLHIPDDAAVIMGHVRMTTQGDGKRNYNNHPFQAKAGRTAFALAHNGVIRNDRTLRKTLKLPGTNIETDSYIAVQLIQQKRALNFDSLRYMAEQVEGSFSFTVLDERDNLYFIKGDSPLYLCHYPRYRLYLYASTAAILMEALSGLPALGVGERVNLDAGELLAVGRDGGQRRSNFQFNDPVIFCRYGHWNWSCGSACGEDEEYVKELKSVAGTFGFTPDQIDRLLGEGYSCEEIEECLYV